MTAAHSGTVIEALADYAASEGERSLPEEVLHHAKRALIDWFAALLPGAQLPPATLLTAALADEFGAEGGAVVYGTGRRAPLRTAALINATASHSIEFDDIFRDAIYHPGCPVIGAALAAAQTVGADGAALLRAIVIGYEVSTRIGVAVQPSHYRYWHTTGTIGTFGAAAATASLLRLDAGRFAHALATAATMAAGLQQAFRSDAMSKPLHAGHAAEAGALSALAASRGVTGALDVLEGEAGFGAAMSRGADWPRAVADLGRRYNICAMTFKNHGCCGHAFAAIDAALALRPGLDLDAIEAITIGTYRTALDVTDRRAVATPFEGRFSTPFTVASALVHGSVRLDAVSPERLADPRVQALMRRVAMVVDPDCEAAFPARRSAVVTVTLTDGRSFAQRQPTRKGDPDAPLTDNELADKFRELASPAVGDAAAADLLATLRVLDTAPAETVAQLGRPGPD
ncbi:MmgE/PrpD family protein [Methylobacterium sp. A49B]|uniref:MmgE/PrpD family protein n=1 Tax=Methylobacterium mesophilicum SR1.6/6 TaxID=908290 RepID=A0A6B9FU23_9HYPH|nr:MmgE/PrpD family protein [Methylobacterium mesophilicum]QGY05359.1 MmgE/PrpD family protein [Methylobacterium mesophilicum SR1.6/6]